MKRIRFTVILLFLSVIFYTNGFTQETQPDDSIIYKTESDILYYKSDSTELDEYLQERCRLDLYFPANKSNFSTVVWFHGGGLKGGNRFIPQQLKNQNMAVAAVNYRLYPKVLFPAYIEDAAAAVAWVFKNIHKYGGNPDLILVSGHSAGGHLCSMVGLDKSWLARHEIEANRIAGLIPFSGHTITHFTIREERGIPGQRPLIDRYAVLYQAQGDAPPLVLIIGDRNLELLARYEENAYLWRMMNPLKPRA
jgi:acetyl esterase/lipase